MKIAVVGLSSNIGGVETFILNTYSVLCDKHEFYFLTSQDNVCGKEEIQKNGDKILQYYPRKKNYFKFKRDLKRIFTENKFDVIWSNNCSLSNITELEIAKRTGVKKRIIHSHNSENMGSKITQLLHFLNKQRLSKIVTDTFACSKVAAEWMFPKSLSCNTKIIHNAIDSNKYAYNTAVSLQVKRELGLDLEKKVIGHVGRFHEQKNHSFIIDVFDLYLRKNDEAVLVLCGEGHLKSEITEKVKRLNISDKVYFLGNRSDMNRIYQIFDCLLFPSLYEGLPFVLVEAQAAGVPCLVSNNISPESKLTDLVKYKNLCDSKESWVNDLIKTMNISKKDTTEEIKDKGYDIFKNSSMLDEVFLKGGGN